LAKSRRLRQALVTVNSDLFGPMVVDVHGLRAVFDVIVMSFAEGTVDKSALCDIALERMGYQGPRSQALLIDNRRDLVEGWRKVGGAGYWFMSDEQFAEDLAQLLG
jgi:FMN phosphatase YigB (HAD superfamily)